nr:MAG TPA: hypothetical protein [Caudoviricetes sp.]
MVYFIMSRGESKEKSLLDKEGRAMADSEAKKKLGCCKHNPGCDEPESSHG